MSSLAQAFLSRYTGLMKNSPILQKIDTFLDERVRRAMALHHGGVEVIDFDESTGKLSVRFQGACDGCTAAALTLKQGLEVAILQKIPEVTEVIAVN